MNMQRKPGFPVANCSIKMPDCMGVSEGMFDDDGEQQQRRQQLINFGHSQWGFNNWSWAVTKQELDFVELTSGKYTAGVVAFVSITVKSFDIHRENIGYATSTANTKGFAIYKSRKCAVTNALRETLLSFGGGVASELQEQLDVKAEPAPAPVAAPPPAPVAEPLQENNQNVANKHNDVKNNVPRKELEGSPLNMRTGQVKNAPVPPVAKAHPMPATLPPAANRPRPPPAPAQPLHRPNSNEYKLEDMTEEEARAERKRRQKLAQEEFRQKQLLKHGETDEPDISKSSLDQLLMDIPTQDIVIEETGDSVQARVIDAKRKSPAPEHSAAKRRLSASKLDIVKD